MQLPEKFAMPRLGETLLVKHSDIRSNGAEEAPAIVTRVWSFDCVNLTVFPDQGGPKLLSSVVHISRGVEDSQLRSCGWYREGE